MSQEKLVIVQDSLNKYHFQTKDDQQITIEHKDRHFIVGLYKWGNEASLEIFLNVVQSNKHLFTANRLETENNRLKVNVYPIDTRSTKDLYGDFDEDIQCHDGGLRFEIVLKSKPTSNFFILPLKSKNLRYSSQPFLTEKDLDEGTRRPLNVEGSIAIYHINKKGNQYLTGKAFHIYRPIAEDALGNKAWCSISVNTYINPTQLQITVPQQFLNEATYPVTIDPDFGYDAIGGSSYEIADDINDDDDRRGSAWEMPAGGGTANYIRARLLGSPGSVSCNCKVFINEKDSGGAGTHAQIATDENLACVEAEHWEEFTLADEELTGEVDYILGVLGSYTSLAGKSELYWVRGDSDGAVDSYREEQTYGAPESPWVVGAEGSTIDYSIFCNYDEGGVETFTKTFTFDALLQKEFTKTFTLDGLLQKEFTKTFTFDGWLQKAFTKTFTLDGILILQKTKDFTLDALLQKELTKTFTLDALLQKSLTQTFTLDGILILQKTKAFTLDALLQKSLTKEFTFDALLQKAFIKTFTLDALLQKQFLKTFTFDGWLQKSLSKAFTLDGILILQKTKAFTLDALLQKELTKTFTFDGLLQKSLTKPFTLDALLQKSLTQTFTLDGLLQKAFTKSFTLDGWLQKEFIKTFTLDALLQKSLTRDFTFDGLLQKSFTQAFTFDALLTKSFTQTFTFDALLQKTLTKTFTFDAILDFILPVEVISDVYPPTLRIHYTADMPMLVTIRRPVYAAIRMNRLIRRAILASIDVESLIRRRVTESFTVKKPIITPKFVKLMRTIYEFLKEEQT